MNQEFFFLMDVILVSRLVFVFREGPLATGGVVFLLAIQGIGLLAYQTGIAWGILLALLVLQALIFHLLEKRRNRSEGLRLLSLATQMLLLSVFFSPSIGVVFNHTVFSSLHSLDRYTLFVTLWGAIKGSASSVVLLGGLLVLNEVNLLIRFQLSALHLVPGTAVGRKPSDGAVDDREYNTGRVIGILERILIYAAMLSNQIAAIGLVLAAKGFTRFKEMDDRRFAEYVLIGTLLSALMAVLVALMVKTLLQL